MRLTLSMTFTPKETSQPRTLKLSLLHTLVEEEVVAAALLQVAASVAVVVVVVVVVVAGAVAAANMTSQHDMQPCDP